MSHAANIGRMSHSGKSVLQYTRRIIENLHKPDTKAFEYLRRNVWNNGDLFKEYPRSIAELLEQYQENIEYNGKTESKRQ